MLSYLFSLKTDWTSFTIAWPDKIPVSAHCEHLQKTSQRSPLMSIGFFFLFCMDILLTDNQFRSAVFYWWLIALLCFLFTVVVILYWHYALWFLNISDFNCKPPWTKLKQNCIVRSCKGKCITKTVAEQFWHSPICSIALNSFLFTVLDQICSVEKNQTSLTSWWHSKLYLIWKINLQALCFINNQEQ